MFLLALIRVQFCSVSDNDRQQGLQNNSWSRFNVCGPYPKPLCHLTFQCQRPDDVVRSKTGSLAYDDSASDRRLSARQEAFFPQAVSVPVWSGLLSQLSASNHSHINRIMLHLLRFTTKIYSNLYARSKINMNVSGWYRKADNYWNLLWLILRFYNINV